MTCYCNDAVRWWKPTEREAHDPACPNGDEFWRDALATVDEKVPEVLWGPECE